jgi:hypothetical protein
VARKSFYPEAETAPLVMFSNIFTATLHMCLYECADVYGCFHQCDIPCKSLNFAVTERTAANYVPNSTATESTATASYAVTSK